MRLTLEVAAELRHVLPDDVPLFVRISATDWLEGGWDLEQSVALAKKLLPLGVDLVDASSAGLLPRVGIPWNGTTRSRSRPHRKEAKIMTGAVGLITETDQANEIITSGSADLVSLAREMLREPYWSLKAQQALKKDPSWPAQYGYAVRVRPEVGPRQIAAANLNHH